MTQAVFNQVSHCCHYEIGQASRIEFPLGGSYGIPYTEPVCTCCGKDCSPVDQCEVCGVVGCKGDCLEGIVDISEGEE
jgi:hypothetical protein